MSGCESPFISPLLSLCFHPGAPERPTDFCRRSYLLLIGKLNGGITINGSSGLPLVGQRNFASQFSIKKLKEENVKSNSS
jgi:hypothetical protein